MQKVKQYEPKEARKLRKLMAAMSEEIWGFNADDHWKARDAIMGIAVEMMEVATGTRISQMQIHFSNGTTFMMHS